MKFRKPAGGLDYMTVMWMLYAALMFWWIPDWRMSPFGLLLLCGALASVGIWFNFRPSGYLFACVNLIAAVLSSTLLTGYFLPDRPFSWKTILMIVVPLYCAFAGLRWAMNKTELSSQR